MINLINQCAGTKNEKIIEWKVVFYVAPLGIFLKLEDALEAASVVEQNSNNNAHPKLTLGTSLLVIPMVAAITASEMEISYR